MTATYPPITSTAIQSVLDAYTSGHRALVLQDRPLHDIDLGTDDDGNPALQTLEYMLARELWRVHRALVVRFTLTGVEPADAERSDDDRRRARARLKRHGIPITDGAEMAREQPSFDVVAALRGLARLLREPAAADRWSGGEPMRFALYLPYAEHLTPAGTTGPLSDQERLAVETLIDLGASLALRRSGHLLLLRGREGVLHHGITGAMHTLRLPHPDADGKRPFVRALQARYPRARLDAGVTAEAIAHLTAHVPNRGLEAAFFASDATGAPVTITALRDQKARDLAELSEHTLLPVDAGRVQNVALAGRTVRIAAELLTEQARLLAVGDRSAQLNILLAGPPSSGKTHLATLAAHQAGVPAFELLSPKNQYVGETDRLARLQMAVLKQLGPCFGMIDEITEAFPVSRGPDTHHGDSGASQAVQAEMFKALSDDSRRGRVTVCAMTNVPDQISAAMLDRFLVAPVLSPVRPDYADIILAIARRTSQLPDLEIERAALEQAAELLAAAEATPRTINAALTSRARPGRPVTADDLLAVARDILPRPGQSLAVAFADLCALRLTSYRSLLPWHDDPAGYPYPKHLADLVDRATGDIDHALLTREIERLRPYANV